MNNTNVRLTWMMTCQHRRLRKIKKLVWDHKLRRKVGYIEYFFSPSRRASLHEPCRSYPLWPVEGALFQLARCLLPVGFYFESRLTSLQTRSLTSCVVPVGRYVESSNVGGGWESASVGGGAGEPGGVTAAEGKTTARTESL